MIQQLLHKYRHSFFVDCLISVVATFIMALSLHLFIAANSIAPGGATGLGVILNYMTGIPVGLATLCINLPLLVLAYFKLGKRFVIQTGIYTLSLTFFLDYLFVNLPVYTEDVLLAMIFGGVLTGVGCGLLLLRNGSSGGSDIIALFITKLKPQFRTGRLILTIDAVIITLSVLVFKNINSALYAVVFLFVSTTVIDKVVYGLSDAKMLLINSHKKSEEIKTYITENLERGVTLIKSTGGYTQEDRNLLMCAVDKRSYIRLREEIKEIDEEAFVIIMDTNDIIGNGFGRK